MFTLIPWKDSLGIFANLSFWSQDCVFAWRLAQCDTSTENNAVDAVDADGMIGVITTKAKATKHQRCQATEMVSTDHDIKLAGSSVIDTLPPYHITKVPPKFIQYLSIHAPKNLPFMTSLKPRPNAAFQPPRHPSTLEKQGCQKGHGWNFHPKTYRTSLDFALASQILSSQTHVFTSINDIIS